MKKYLLGAVALCFLMQVKAQETDESVKTKIKEVGATTTSLTNSFGLTYRVGNEKMVWRFNMSSGAYSYLNDNQSIESRTSKNVNVSGKIGLEFRKPVTEKLAFRYGFDIGVAYGKNTRETAFDSVQIYPRAIEQINSGMFTALYGVLGVNYDITEYVVIGAEVAPYFGVDFKKQSTLYTDGSTEESKPTSFGAGISNSPVLLSVVIRF